MRIVFQLLLATHLIAGFSGAALCYVDPSGNDTSSGLAAAPFLTLTRAVQAAGPGDTVLVRDGTYGHLNSVTKGDGPNAPDAWTTIRAEHNWGTSPGDTRKASIVTTPPATSCCAATSSNLSPTAPLLPRTSSTISAALTPGQPDHGLYLKGSNFTITKNIFYNIRMPGPFSSPTA